MGISICFSLLAEEYYNLNKEEEKQSNDNKKIQFNNLSYNLDE